MTVLTPRPEIGWTGEWTATGLRRRLPIVGLEATACAVCWGQRRIYEPAGNGEGLIPTPCPGCSTEDDEGGTL